MDVSLSFQPVKSHIGDALRTNPDRGYFNDLINSLSFFNLIVNLNNEGSASAKDMYIVVQTDEKFNYKLSGGWDLSKTSFGQAAFRAHRSIHPGEITKVFTALSQDKYKNIDKKRRRYDLVPDFTKLSLRILIYAEECQKEELLVEFTQDDLDFWNSPATKIIRPESS